MWKRSFCIMVRRRRWSQLATGVTAGVVIGVFFKLCLWTSTRNAKMCHQKLPDPLALINLEPNHTQRALVFVGVMTAQQYLETRARAVQETWAKDLPGKLVFFSSEESRAKNLPLVPLPGVDDSYPPQKKSFLMLMFMFEHYGDKFDWFMRADDDVYVRGDKLEKFLRSIDSSKPHFIGQAGRGTVAEKDALGLEYNENFCMGGPGVLMSRETLRRVAPHAKYCLEHLYTKHEDVELGRCVAKFAGVSCTWSYDMQTILHHNSSGAAAYTRGLKSAEVHRSITLHPVKHPRTMYNLHSYFKNLQIRDIRDEIVALHREIATCLRKLNVSKEKVEDYRLPSGELLFPAKHTSPDYLGDNNILGAPVALDRYQPENLEDIIPYNFVTKSVYSINHSNPRRKIEAPLREALDDVIREVMEIINEPSRQRGRIIDFNEMLYGYYRLDPLHGVDYVLDLLLRYRRYRGRKLTAAVRRHAYVQQSFGAMEIREVPIGEPPPSEEDEVRKRKEMNLNNGQVYEDFDESSQQSNRNYLDFSNLGVKNVFGKGLSKLKSNFPSMLKWNSLDRDEYSVHDRRINFILPLSGRYDAFSRFMRNYEDIVLKSSEVLSLIIVLYMNKNNVLDYAKTETLIGKYKEMYNKDIKLVRMGSTAFSRGAAITEGLHYCSDDDLLFFIDVDMMFNFVTLRRIRFNTIKYNQVYFPIVFSEYNPDVVNGIDFNPRKVETIKSNKSINQNVNNKYTEKELLNIKYSKEINNEYGYFREYGFGIASMFKCDLMRVGGFNLSIKGWGFEDVQLFETLIKSNLSVYRTADDSLIHKYHNVECDKDLDKSKYLMCIGTKASTFGSEKQLTYYILNHPEILWPQTVKGKS